MHNPSAMKVPPLRKISLLSAALWLSFATAAAAQPAAGEIRGHAVDISGAALPDVTVTIVSTDTRATRVMHSDTSGRFTVPSVPAGHYEITAELAGFAPQRQEDVTVHVGEALGLTLELRPATNAETLTLADRPMTLDPRRSHPAALLTPAAVTHLPVKSRNITDLVPTAPAVTRDRQTWEIVIAGQPGMSNAMSVDGGELIGFGSYQFAQEAIEELRVETSGYQAEYGRTSGAVVNAITKSGTNQLHGSALAFRSAPFGTPRDLDTNQAGGALGGPLVRDRHFFFVDYDTLRRSQGAREQDAFLIRSDHQITGNDRLTFRYADQDLRDMASHRSALAAVTTVLGSHLVNDGRVHYAQARDLISANRFQVADSLTWVGGGHAIKAGFDAVGDDPAAAMPFRTLARTTFASEQMSQFVQDEWMAARSFTLNLGVRHDIGNDWDPRVGVAWLAARHVLARGSYGRFSSPFTQLSVRQGNAGVEWEWMPRTTLTVNYLDHTAPAWEYRAVTAEAARRLWQGTEYRLAYTVTRTIGREGELARYEPRHRMAASFVYDTRAFADRFDGVVTAILTDWTVSGIYAVQSSDPRLSGTPMTYWSLDPRLARNVQVGRGRTLAFVLESYNLTGRPNLLLVTDPIYSGEPGPEGRITQLGVRFLF